MAHALMSKLPDEQWRGYVQDPFQPKYVHLCAVALIGDQPFVWYCLHDRWAPAFDMLACRVFATWGMHGKKLAEAWKRFHESEFMNLSDGTPEGDARRVKAEADRDAAREALRELERAHVTLPKEQP